MTGLTEKQRQTLRDEAEWREKRDAARPAVGASGVGVTALAGLGWTCWSKTRGHAGVGEDGSQLDPTGGIVIAVSDRPDENGELHRTLTTYDASRLPHQRIAHLDEAEVDRDSIGLPNVAHLRRSIRDLARQVAADRRTLGFDAEARVATMSVLRGLL